MKSRSSFLIVLLVLIVPGLCGCGQNATASNPTEARKFVPGKMLGKRFAVILMLEGDPPIELMRGELAFSWHDPECGTAAASVLSPTADADRLAAEDSVHEHADSIRSTLHILSGLILHEGWNDDKGGVYLVAQPEIQDNSVALHIVQRDGALIGDWSHDGWGVKARGSIVLTDVGFQSKVKCLLSEEDR